MVFLFLSGDKGEELLHDVAIITANIPIIAIVFLILEPKISAKIQKKGG